MVHYHQDYLRGKENEKKVLEIIKEFWKDREIIHETDKWCKYDFSCKNYTYELKTRTNTYSRYPTTMITCNKLEKGRILLFSYTDGLYFIEYDEEQFKDFETASFSRYGQVWDEKLHIYIPIDKLTLILKY